MKRLCLALCLAAGLAACVTPPPEFSNGSPVANARSFTLDQAQVWKQRLPGMSTSETEFMLARGSYQAELENAQGTLFRGPRHAVAYQIVGGYSVMPGGVWIPRNREEKARLYIYVGSTDEVRYRDRAALLEAMRSGTSNGISSAEWASLIPDVTPEPRTNREAMAQAGANAARRVADDYIARQPKKDSPGRPAPQWEIQDPALEALLRARAR